MDDDFLYYPEYSDTSFYEDIYRKKEFNRNKIDAEEYYNQTLEDICSSKEKLLQPHQEFVRNYLSDQTPYKNLLLFHGVGTGKCILPESRVKVSIEVSSEVKTMEELWNIYSTDVVIDEDGGEWSSPKIKLKISSLNDRENKLETRKINKLYRQRVAENIRIIKLETGHMLRLTKIHPLFTDSGWSNNITHKSKICIVADYKPKFVKIKEIFEEDYQGYVYDLEVKDLHNYVANDIICHNTCAAISISEGLKSRLEDLDKKVYILSPGQTKQNFEKEIYNFDLERAEIVDGVEPGSYQCTGQTYYIPLEKGKDNIKKRERTIKRKAFGRDSIYRFYGHGTSFPNYVEQILPRLFKRPDEVFSNSVIIVDEVHDIISEKKDGKGISLFTPQKNTFKTLQDIFSGYHQFKREWVDKNKKKIKQEKLSSRKVEALATAAWTKLSEAERKKYLKYGAKNVTLILLSATPMENEPKEIIKLVNLMRLNDNKILIDQNKLFKNIEKESTNIQDEINEDYFCRMIRGYISYVRGQNPITFPHVRDPDKDLLYNPRYIPSDTGEKCFGGSLNIEGDPIPKFKIDGTEYKYGIKIPLKLVFSPMSISQYSVYLEYIEKENIKLIGMHGMKGTLALGIKGRQISNMVFPTENLRIQGDLGFNQTFKETINKVDGKTEFYYTFTKMGEEHVESLIKADPYNPNNSPNKEFGQLSNYSVKFNQILENMSDPRQAGITFCYSEFKKCGAIIFGIVAELNGFVKFKNYQEENRDIYYIPIPAAQSTLTKGKKYKETPPLIYRKGYYNNLVNESIYKKIKRQYRCYKCSQLVNHPVHDLDKDTESNTHRFIQGTYILFIPENKRVVYENSVLNRRENSDGKIIKLVAGSRFSSEGVNFMNVRQVHILDPWHHPMRLYQAMGRAIRHCSHKNLGKRNRNVTIYKYSGTVPLVHGKTRKDQDNYLRKMIQENKLDETVVTNDIPKIEITNRDLATETMDEQFYFRLIRKDFVIKHVERLMKKNAIDCALFKAINQFPQNKFPGEEDCSRVCDYLPCKYKCTIECGTDTSEEKTWDEDKEYEVNEDTYSNFYSEMEVDRIIRYLQKIFLENWTLKLEDIVKLVRKRDKKLELQYIYSALDKMITRAPKRPILKDRYNREGHLILRGDYYTFQPFSLTDESIPLYYRKSVPKVQQHKINLERIPVHIKPKQVKAEDIINKNKIQKLRERLSNLEVYRAESELDRLSPNEFEYLYEEIKLNPEPIDNIGVLENYLRKRNLLLQVKKDNILGHYINPKQARKFDKKKNAFTKAGLIDVNKANTYLKTQLKLDYNQKKDDFDSDIYLFSADKDRLTVSEDILEKHNLGGIDVNTDRFYGYYDKNKKNEKDRFSLVDLNSEKILLTKGGRVSQKSFAKGKSCAYFELGNLVNIAKILSMNKLLTEEEKKNLRLVSSNRHKYCKVIEETLRILNERDPKKRWILYPGEEKYIERIAYTGDDGELYSRHILNFFRKKV